MTYGKNRIMSGLHIVRKRLKQGPRFYVYAWRGGPCVHSQDGNRPTITQEILAKAHEARKGDAPHGNLAALIHAYKASPEYTEKRSETRKDYDFALDKITAEFGPAPLPAFDDRRMRRDVIEWRNRWRDKPRTADKLIVMLGIMLRWGMLRGFVTINVAQGIPLIYKSDRSDMIWTDEHWFDCPTHLESALRFIAMTGLRLKDAVTVEWGSVHDKAIVLKTSKRGGRAVIPILPELRAWLDALDHKDGALLRNSRGKPWTTSGLESVFQKHKPEGFDRRIHDLRGTFVTWLAIKGLTDEEIARIVGWTAKRVSEIRARYVDEARVIVSLVDRLSA